MKDKFYIIMFLLIMVCLLAIDLVQDQRIMELEEQVNSLNEQIVYVELEND